jgi:uncharacterized protein (UPF0332 family)
METEKDLSKHRIAQAEQCLKDAKNLLENSGYKSAANRAYYCAFHSMRSLLALDKIDYKSHKAVISDFRLKYIKTGILETNLSEILTTLFRVRTDADYDDFFVIEKEETEKQIENAELFFEQIKEYLQSILK